MRFIANRNKRKKKVILVCTKFNAAPATVSYRSQHFRKLDTDICKTSNVFCLCNYKQKSNSEYSLQYIYLCLLVFTRPTISDVYFKYTCTRVLVLYAYTCFGTCNTKFVYLNIRIEKYLICIMNTSITQYK